MKSDAVNPARYPAGVTIVPYGDISPTVPESVLVLPGARIIGDVEIGENSSIWYNVVVRGDVNYIRIGSETNIQDGSILHVTRRTHPLIVGNLVTAGHAVRLHGCTVEDETLIGIGAIVLDGAVVEKHSMVAAGAVVPPGFRVPSGTLVAGVPAKVRRDLRPTEIKDLADHARRYVDYSRKTMDDWAGLRDMSR
jgi:carbonic anhydrase/acetyltransferase-like protein (isoleucine patch superfamily)